jgi:hypothetical protein
MLMMVPVQVHNSFLLLSPCHGSARGSLEAQVKLSLFRVPSAHIILRYPAMTALWIHHEYEPLANEP